MLNENYRIVKINIFLKILDFYNFYFIDMDNLEELQKK